MTSKDAEGSIAKELDRVGPRPDQKSDQKSKKNWAEALSRELALKFADSLRKEFPSIRPTPDGKGHESRARTAKGVKKLDVNFSTSELGLGLGVSIKTINAKDPKSNRYTKNLTRVDAELRAEAKDYHQRQPYAVMIAVIFLPADACDDGDGRTPSSFGSAVRQFRFRANRRNPTNEEELFERVFIGVYRDTQPDRGKVWFFDALSKPRKVGPPRSSYRLTWAELIEQITWTHDMRNDPPFEWDDEDDVDAAGE